MSLSGVRILLPDELTVPIPGSMVIVVAQVVHHSNLVSLPADTSAGLAAKVRITGSWTGVLATTVVSGVVFLWDEGR